jgi:hypothetical protein
MEGSIAKELVKIVIEGVVYELIKSGAEWLFRNPPKKRPPVIWSEGRVFHLQPNGRYRLEPFRQE